MGYEVGKDKSIKTVRARCVKWFITQSAIRIDSRQRLKCYIGCNNHVERHKKFRRLCQYVLGFNVNYNSRIELL